MFVEAADPLGHLRVGVGIGGLLLLGRLVQGIHVGLLGGHLLLEGLRVCVGRSKKNGSLTSRKNGTTKIFSLRRYRQPNPCHDSTRKLWSAVDYT